MADDAPESFLETKLDNEDDDDYDTIKINRLHDLAVVLQGFSRQLSKKYGLVEEAPRAKPRSPLPAEVVEHAAQAAVDEYKATMARGGLPTATQLRALRYGRDETSRKLYTDLESRAYCFSRHPGDYAEYGAVFRLFQAAGINFGPEHRTWA